MRAEYAGAGDMEYGALLGAGAYVCMYVIGLVIQIPPEEAMHANPALVRDVSSYLLLLCLTFPIFLNGLSLRWVLLLNGVYALLTGGALPGVAKYHDTLDDDAFPHFYSHVPDTATVAECGRTCRHIA
jgi:Ca2+/Na+ antiporter